MKRLLTITILISSMVWLPVGVLQARYFTDPNTPLVQTDADSGGNGGKGGSSSSSSSGAFKRKPAQFGVKLGYCFSPTFEDEDGYEYFDDDGDRICLDLGMELIFNPGNYFGFGFGLAVPIDSYTYDDYYGNSYTDSLVLVPVYALFKVYLGNATAPYLSFGIGYNVSTNYSSTDSSVDVGSTSGGLHYSAGLGLLIAETLQIEVSFSHTEGAYEIYNTTISDYQEVKFTHERIAVSAAVFF